MNAQPEKLLHVSCAQIAVRPATMAMLSSTHLQLMLILKVTKRLPFMKLGQFHSVNYSFGPCGFLALILLVICEMI